jgi:hypothetical protein
MPASTQAEQTSTCDSTHCLLHLQAIFNDYGNGMFLVNRFSLACTWTATGIAIDIAESDASCASTPQEAQFPLCMVSVESQMSGRHADSTELSTA